ncbi:MAG: hypothetical protein EOO80_04905 [Oxalobacteraceae bacterium]|nr:MAG: hypothetical protein EOO80_04905 [Oxalobacteraceae bacterium]
MKRILPLLLVLSACAALPGSTAQLERMTQAQSQGLDAQNAAEVPGDECTKEPGAPACQRIQAIRGRACLALARKEAAEGAACPPPSARKHLDCAVAAFASAGGTTAGEMEDKENLAENTARARYCAAGYRSTPADALQLLRQARTGLDTLAPNPRRDLMNASAALAIAQRETVPSADATGGAPAGVVTAAQGTQNAARQLAARLGNCTGV